MTQRVGTGSSVQPRDGQVFLQHSPHASCGQDVSESIHEDGCLLAERFGLVAASALGSLGGDCLDRERSQRTDAFLASFPAHANDGFVKIQVTVLHPHLLADPQTGAVHRFQNRSVAKPINFVGRWRDQQSTDFIIAQDVWQFTLLSRIA